MWEDQCQRTNGEQANEKTDGTDKTREGGGDVRAGWAPGPGWLRQEEHDVVDGKRGQGLGRGRRNDGGGTERVRRGHGREPQRAVGGVLQESHRGGGEAPDTTDGDQGRYRGDCGRRSARVSRRCPHRRRV